jgi:hypothetical protein
MFVLCLGHISRREPAQNQIGASDMGIMNARRKVDGPGEILRGSNGMAFGQLKNLLKIRTNDP